VSPFVHRIAAVFFYLFAGSFFVSYLLLRNNLLFPWSQWWLRVADVPLALVAVLYGGSSLYRSIKRHEGTSWPLLILIGTPLLALFTFIVALNFWNALGLPQGPAI